MSNRSPKLILASQSPRRQQLLTANGFVFDVIAPDDSVEMSVSTDCLPEEYVINSAKAKAGVIAKEVTDGIVLGADTVAECNGHILGKPVDRAHAEQMLRLMSGQTHRVLTGVCLWHKPSDHFSTHIEQTIRKMDELSDELLNSILDSNGWVGKAGAFGYQDDLDWLNVVSGLESTVVGLPVEKLKEWINELRKCVA